MNSLKDETIHKIFGANIQGGMGLALTLLNRASIINWEALWPQFQKAMIGLGVVAIATIQGEAIRKGLSGLAERIASFQPTVSPMPGKPLTWAEAMPVPYIPIPSIPGIMERIKVYPPEAVGPIEWIDELLKESIQTRTRIDGPNCGELEQLLLGLQNAMTEVHLGYYDSGASGEVSYGASSYYGQEKNIRQEAKKVRERMEELGCSDTSGQQEERRIEKYVPVS